MTNKEAIEVLKKISLYYAPGIIEPKDFYNAFDLAIEALETIDDVSPCANCQEWDCYGCKVKEEEQ